MPQQIELSADRSIQNMYATDGRKLKTTVKEGEELMDGTKYYNANFVFDKQKEMEYILFDEGRIVNYGGNLEYEYHVKDHLGSVRVAFNPTADGPNIVQENAYYPFGGTIDDFSYNASENRYKHTGMEAIDDFGLNMLDNNARWRDVSAVPRFYAIDPLAEKYYSISPYAYCGNNPMRYVDPTGMEFTQKSWELLNKLEDEAIKQRDLHNTVIGFNNSIIGSGLFSAGVERMLESKNDELEAKNKELAAIPHKIKDMDKSNQMYDLQENNLLATGVGESKFNFSNGYYEMRIPMGAPMSLLSHEFWHGYQFEKGWLSSGFSKEGYPFYDQYDEVEAYRFGALFGGPLYNINNLPAMYNRFQLFPASVNSPRYRDPSYDWQDLANQFKSAFRVNGVTYHYK